MATNYQSLSLEKKLDALIEYFNSSGNTLGFAESCTGGLASSWVTSRSGVSKFYMGSLVTYSYQMKEKYLGVPKSLLNTLGAVSRPVALKMAQGVRREMKVDWSLSITGIAGPTGGTPQKPVGTVCFAVCGPGFERDEEHLFKESERRSIQLSSVEYGLGLLLECVHL